MRRTFFCTNETKTLFALIPTQNVGLMRCLLIVFGTSKTRLKKRLFKIKLSNNQDTSTKRLTFFYASQAKNSFCIRTETKTGTPTLLSVNLRHL